MMTIVRIDAEARWSDVVIHNNTLYILSSELAERVIEGVHFTLSVEEENAVLKKRLVDLSNRIVFAPAKAAAAPAAEPAP